MRERIGWIVLVVLLIVWGANAGGGMWILKKEKRVLEKEIKIQEIELLEYEKNIKTLHEIAKGSSVTYDTITLQFFDSTRANFKRHLEQLRQFKD